MGFRMTRESHVEGWGETKIVKVSRWMGTDHICHVTSMECGVSGLARESVPWKESLDGGSSTRGVGLIDESRATSRSAVCKKKPKKDAAMSTFTIR